MLWRITHHPAGRRGSREYKVGARIQPRSGEREARPGAGRARVDAPVTQSGRYP